MTGIVDRLRGQLCDARDHLEYFRRRQSRGQFVDDDEIKFAEIECGLLLDRLADAERE